MTNKKLEEKISNVKIWRNPENEMNAELLYAESDSVILKVKKWGSMKVDKRIKVDKEKLENKWFPMR